ncbi:hypothetical protein HYH03_013569 [Edaphochlamys debaryana]|uniref:Uncharacterized protein n=1 Tax=Edaphochlamys debaryana TaxID=47281 RepID=A0A835XQS9_9CHLO|nr:hypothetical protein HYH03_013569 [Edaphochlamys debaryana]|eukprot:KAG2487852.1 hypothetical protein HYH03_013569 [Edaphochlamys debaryana]
MEPGARRADATAQLFIAAAQGLVLEVHQRLADGADINASNKKYCYCTPLHVAVRHGHLAVVEALLGAGADTEADGEDIETPLFKAITSRQLDVAKALLRAGADTEATDVHGYTPLHMAVAKGDAAGTRALLEAGANTETVNTVDHTPLWTASSSGHSHVVLELLSFGARVEGSSEAVSPLWIACWEGRSKAVVGFLLDRGADTEATNNARGWTALHAAAISGHEAIVRLLLPKRPRLGLPGANMEAADVDGATPLCAAARRGHAGVVRMLVAAGADRAAADAWPGLRHYVEAVCSANAGWP